MILSSFLYNWYTSELHRQAPEPDTEARRRLGWFARVVYFSKRFLPDNTTITAMPSDNEQRVAWITAVRVNSTTMMENFIAFLKRKLRDNKLKSTLSVVKSKMYEVDLADYPNPLNVIDSATTPAWNYTTATMEAFAVERDRKRELKRKRNSNSDVDGNNNSAPTTATIIQLFSATAATNDGSAAAAPG